MRRSGMMIIITMVTFTISLVILGAFMLVSLNINHMSNFFASRLEIRVYLRDDITQADIENFQDRIKKMETVKEVQFIHKDDAWRDFQSHFKNVDLRELLNENPLPHAFKVKLTENEHMPAMAKHLGSFTDYVEEVGFLELLSQRLTLIARMTKWIGFSVALLLTLATLMIIVNTIRLTVIAREHEITIMTLVGATPSLIRWPFLIEGLFIGLIGGGVSSLILCYSYRILIKKIVSMIPYLPLYTDGIMLSVVYGSIMLIGVGLGMLGAYLSISKSLKSTY